MDFIKIIQTALENDSLQICDKYYMAEPCQWKKSDWNETKNL